MPNKLILGIDPGLANMGIAVIELISKDKFIIRHSETIRTHLRQKNRLKYLSDSVKRVCGNYNIDIASVEQSLMGINPGTSISLAMALGAINLSLEQLGIEYKIHNPTEIKKIITGQGNAKKDHMTFHVQKYIQSSIKDYSEMTDHEVDAICIGICGVYDKI